MNLSRFGIALCLILGIAGLVQAQPACDWTTDTVSGINRIWQNCGRVGIGTQPSYPLHLVDTGTSADTSIAAFRSLSTNYTQTNRIDQGLWFAAYFNATTHNGSMIGQRVDSFNLASGTVFDTTASLLFAGLAGGTGTVSNAYGQRINIYKGSGTVTTGYGVFVQAIQANTGYGVYLNDVDATTGWGIYQTGSNDTNYFAGKTGIGTSSPGSYLLNVNGTARFGGDVTVDGNLAARFQDVAEWVPATSDMAPGTVVVLNPEAVNEVMPSARSYDTTVAGVVSAQPGLILGVAGSAKEQIATTGRVRVRVDATRAPINVGDLLVTSDEPGTAMRSEPLTISGRSFHQPGTIVGKALEPLAKGQGEILVLLSLQ